MPNPAVEASQWPAVAKIWQGSINKWDDEGPSQHSRMRFCATICSFMTSRPSDTGRGTMGGHAFEGRGAVSESRETYRVIEGPPHGPKGVAAQGRRIPPPHRPPFFVCCSPLLRVFLSPSLRAALCSSPKRAAGLYARERRELTRELSSSRSRNSAQKGPPSQKQTPSVANPT